ncbi:type II toxin-antitoxin system RelE/ParE family toxin [Natronospirillum operosum]|uniref:Type II toxin-antitoxin system RelE/ParE family toxin n=1 Tax=Natronospirillum operosum TaxID=2759953 RepID=A0A4Z0W6K8_9GAMM|nr:type II toxin-antitoxin system RelE/ParE family toxin [Natronospirillum operosum]TGG91783.1 type II toxin-antitoxin system RelE/ParE family toxin [Natronospirillum operosum]
MASVGWTEEAEHWLSSIYDYIMADNPAAAERVIMGIMDAADRAADFPEAGYLYRRDGDFEIRIALYGHYRITYAIQEGVGILVLGVFHGALDLDRYLHIDFP